MKKLIEAMFLVSVVLSAFAVIVMVAAQSAHAYIGM